MQVANRSSATDAIAIGRTVLAQEIAGLEALAVALDDAFTRAVERIESLPGRLIVSGMGKSGHVGRKIASTFASTGTPAHFVHPAEASHGDLGMITAQDGVLALSNSGETAELGALITYAKRFHIPLIAMVRRRSSMLVEAADIALILPQVKEASPVDAPTTSTTMMMALGDALAVALLQRRGFTRADFAAFHPGGALGSAWRLVKDVMHTGVAIPLIPVSASMQEAMLEMTARRFGCVGVVDDSGALAGVITDGDLRRHMAPGILERNVAEIMTKSPLIIGSTALAAEALAMMNEKSVTVLFVVEQGKPVGILHIHDLLRIGVA